MNTKNYMKEYSKNILDKQKTYRVAILATHIIQYRCPLFKKLAESNLLDLTVLFCSEQGAAEYNDNEFKVNIKWDRNLLEGYRYILLKNYSPLQKTKDLNFLQFINLDLFNTLRKGKYDAIVIYGYGWFISWYAWVSAVILKIPIFFVGENTPAQLEEKQSIKNSIKKIYIT